MMNEESLKAWEQENIEILTSREMGEWLHRRDMNARPQIETITNEEETQIYPINQEENCKIVREFLCDIANIKDLPLYKVGNFQLPELRRWLTSQGYSEGTVDDKINEFTRFVEKIRGEEE